MPAFRFHWSDDLIEYLAQHGVTADEFEDVVQNPQQVVRSRSSGELAAKGVSFAGRRLFCVFRQINEFEIEPVAAYEIGY